MRTNHEILQKGFAQTDTKQSLAIWDSIEVYEKLLRTNTDYGTQPLCDEFFNVKFDKATLQTKDFICTNCPWLKFLYNTPCFCEVWLRLNYPMLGAMRGFDSLQNPEYDSVDLENHLKNALLHWTDLTLEQPNIFRQRLVTNARNHPLVTELSTEAEREENLAFVFQTTLNECLDEVAREREDCLKRLINMFKLWSEML